MMPIRIVTKGSTNPAPLFQSALTYERDTKLHLVLLMTDGEWEEHEDNHMRRYAQHNRYTVFFKFNEGVGQGYSTQDSEDRQDALRKLSKFEPDEAYLIGALEMIPQTLENLLATLVATV